MREFINRSIKLSIFSSFLFLIIGFIMFVFPEQTLNWITLVIEILLILYGAITVGTYIKADKQYDMFSYNFIFGVMSIVFAIFLMINPTFLVSIFPVVIGLWMTIGGIIKFKICFDFKESKFSIIYMIGAIIMFTCGISIVFNPFAVAKGLMTILGIAIVIYSLIDILESIMFLNHIKKFNIK